MASSALNESSVLRCHPAFTAGSLSVVDRLSHSNVRDQLPPGATYPGSVSGHAIGAAVLAAGLIIGAVADVTLNEYLQRLLLPVVPSLLDTIDLGRMHKVAIDEDLTMLIGAGPNRTLLETGVLDLDGDDPVVIHAMPLRPKFYRFLG